MQKFKLFTGSAKQPEVLESAVNTWLLEQGVKIHHVAGNVGGSGNPDADLALFIFYETERGLR